MERRRPGGWTGGVRAAALLLGTRRRDGAGPAARTPALQSGV